MDGIIKRLRCIMQSQKILLIVFACCYVIGLILGIVFFSEAEKVFFAKNVVDFLVCTLSKEGNVGGLLLLRILNSLALFVVFALFLLCSWLIPFPALIVVYRGYVLGAALVAFLSGFGITGAVLFVFCVFLQNVITTVALIVFTAVACDFIKKARKLCNLNIKDYVLALIIAFLISVIGALVEFILLSLIFRPLNFYF